MSYLALARRYRPGDFENILSQNHVTTTLRNAVMSGRISHAYLFCGPRGTGKTTTARVLAKALNCAKGPTPEPCGECTSCKEITAGSSPDVFEIDAASNRGIDDIRELRENVRYSPIGGHYKIYIIDEVHRLTKEAFDALLKTLEEPPSHVIFIFATTDPQALPATILSRTQRYDFKRIPVSGLAEAVNSVAKREGMNIEPGAALLVAKKADGSMRDALSLLDQLSSFTEGPIDAEKAAEVLGMVKTELLSEISGAIINHNTRAALDKLGEYIKGGGDSQELADGLAGYIRALLLIKSGVNDIELLELDSAEMESARELLGDIDMVDILRYFTALADYKGPVKQGQDPVYALEATLVKMSAMDRAVSLSALLSGAPPAPNSSPTTNSRPETKHAPPTDMTMKPTAARPSKPEPDQAPIQKATAPLDGSPVSFEKIVGNWTDFCGEIKKSKAMLFGYLSICKLQRMQNGILTLGLEAKFQLDQLSKMDNKRFIENSLKDYFQSDIKISLKLIENGQAAVPGASPTLGPDKLFDGMPEARKLFDDLGGEIIGQ